MLRIALALVCALGASGAFAAEPGANTVVLGTGGGQSVFESFGKALCARGKTVSGLGCEMRENETWLNGLQALADGRVNFTFLTTDRLLSVVEGDVELPNPAEWRAVLALPATQVTILARPDRNIAVADDMRGRKIRTAPPQILGAFLDWLAEDKWGADDLAGFGPMGFENSVNGVCAGEFDAVVFLDGHPGELTDLAIKRCPLRLVPLADETVAKLVLTHPEIVATTIPGGIYPGTDKPVASIGGYTVLLTTASTPDALVERWLGAILAGYAEVQAAHKSLAPWTADKLRPRAFPVPIHPGAERAFAAKGLGPK
ncbi:MAG: TAXI family TRAP transporter solute-binding subunit [Alphaproteobacteria bacterium]|nr:TAXI family TRAP transporter solute-binding subunit [Alphaproteobacteria bacterium]